MTDEERQAANAALALDGIIQKRLEEAVREALLGSTTQAYWIWADISRHSQFRSIIRHIVAEECRDIMRREITEVLSARSSLGV